MADRVAGFKVLLIGGASSAGKTTLAHAVAAAIGAEVMSLDPLRDGQLEEELAAPATWTRSPDEIVALIVAAGKAFAALLAEQVETARAEKRTTVIEGERILPGHVLGVADGVRALFLVEDDPAALRENLAARSRRFASLTPSVQATVVEVDYRLGRLIEREAVEHGHPVLRPRPWETSVRRAEALLGRR